MRILHVLFSRGWGGLERYAIELAKRTAQRGHDVAFIARDGTPTAEALSNQDLILGDFWRPVNYIDVPIMVRLRKIITSRQVDVVHVHHSADLGLTAPALWRATGIKLIFSNYMQTPKPKQDAYHQREYGRVDKVLVSSGFLKKNVVANLPVDEQVVEILPYGLDLDRFTVEQSIAGSFRAAHHIPANVPLVGVISRLDPLKGQREMIQAAPAIIAAVPDVHIALVGDETPEFEGVMESELKSLATTLGIADRIHFTGYEINTANALADLTVYALPTHSETYSIACLEAMAMGKAIVGTDAGGTPEMLGKGEYGLLCKPKDPLSLAEKVIELLNDGPKRELLGGNARRRAREFYSFDAVIDRLINIYEEIDFLDAPPFM
jgi:glycosyltransferase involved in cell wall biosynthesis